MANASIFVKKPVHERIPAIRQLGDYCTNALIEFMRIDQNELNFMHEQTAAVVGMDSLAFSRHQWKDYFEGHLRRMFKLRNYCPQLFDGIVKLNNVVVFGTWAELKLLIKGISKEIFKIGNGLVGYDPIINENSLRSHLDQALPSSLEGLNSQDKQVFENLQKELRGKSAGVIFENLSQTFSRNVGLVFTAELTWMNFLKLGPNEFAFQEYPDLAAGLLAIRLWERIRDTQLPQSKIKKLNFDLTQIIDVDKLKNYLAALTLRSPDSPPERVGR
jgi:hypothetical protein